jgi:hypothetical protein
MMVAGTGQYDHIIHGDDAHCHHRPTKAGDEVWVNHCGNFHSQRFVVDILAWITPLTW